MVCGGQGRIKGVGADLRPLSVRQPWLRLTSLWRPAKPTGISCYTGAVPYGDISVPPLAAPPPIPPLSPPPPPSTGDNITGESGWEGLVCALPQPVRDPPQRELSPLSPDARRPSLTLRHGIHMAPAASPSCLRRGEPRHGRSRNREELSVAHLGTVNLSYAADKGELSGSLPHCLWET